MSRGEGGVLLGDPAGRRYVITDYGSRIVWPGGGMPIHRERLVTDEFGDAFWVRLCPDCVRWLRPEGFTVKRSTNRYYGYCPECRAARAKARRDANLEEHRRIEREREARKKREDPEYAEKLRAYHRRYRVKVRMKDPESFRAAEREIRRREYLRLKADPGAYQEYLENRRIDETRGKVNLPIRYQPLPHSRHEIREVPVEPLAAYLEDWMVRRKVWDPVKRCSIEYPPTMEPVWTYARCALQFELAERRLYVILKRKQGAVRVDIVDRVCTKGLGDPGLMYVLYPELSEVKERPERDWEAAAIIWEDLLCDLDDATLKRVMNRMGRGGSVEEFRRSFPTSGQVPFRIIQRIKDALAGTARR